jgi:hypothetical protein
MPTISIVSYRKTRRKPSCEAIAKFVPHGEKQNSFILQLSLAHEYELELLLIVDELEDDEEFAVLPFDMEFDPNDHR